MMNNEEPAATADVRRTRRLITLLGGGTVLLAAGFGLMPWLVTRPRPAPDVQLTLLDGTQPRLADLRGRVVLMSFWSTTCAPCMEEMPTLIEFHRRNAPRGLMTIAVAMKHDRPDMVLGMSQRRQFPFDVALDVQGETARAFFNTAVTPTKYLIDPQGQVVRTHVGRTDFADLQARIDGLLRGHG
jgi:thiol-disulfide isomerase/thioredoxin